MTRVTPQVALLVDADNAALGSLNQVLTILGEHGEVNIRRAYGNWFKSALRAWDTELNRRGIRPIQQSDPVKGKNATDLALVIDAIELHHTVTPDVYGPVSSDSDYTPLAHFLRERGAKVIGFGNANTAASFQAACTLFCVLADPNVGKPKTEPKRQPTLAQLLSGAITKNADKQGWARVSAVANHMRQQHGQAAKDHGKSTWTKVLKATPDYEFRNEGTTNVAVRPASR
ncbi:NYN domain-containing protein [Tessaracoccus sp. OS52]|uniref:NYN domain-containing protein n=1 Tax=Tessaracoccus sp. OS52 TaxID=2886691 RepID=UPI001D0F635E|nr:NYN domain-containing protein [Tessaracoccus sp. OS52]MCC2592729.1 NYN domain-containing protein [Tessaracoccus sp. OS52]